MITARFTYEGGLRVAGVHERSGAPLTTDAPPDNRGKGQAFSPTDLVAAALVTCMMTVVGIEIEDGRLPRVEMAAEVSKEMASGPRRVARLAVDYHVTGALTPDERARLERVARACPVAHSLHPDIAQDVTFHFH